MSDDTLRSVDLELGRPGFTLNPTSCTKKEIEATVTQMAIRLGVEKMREISTTAPRLIETPKEKA